MFKGSVFQLTEKHPAVGTAEVHLNLNQINGSATLNRSATESVVVWGELLQRP